MRELPLRKLAGEESDAIAEGERSRERERGGKCGREQEEVEHGESIVNSDIFWRETSTELAPE